jgi:hypothetical protein
VKVGDLVRSRDDPEMGIGVIVDISMHIEDVLVQWSHPPLGETELRFWHLIKGLELVSECE